MVGAMADGRPSFNAPETCTAPSSNSAAFRNQVAILAARADAPRQCDVEGNKKAIDSKSVSVPDPSRVSDISQ